MPESKPSNDKLRRVDLPHREHGQLAWIEFALTFDGYEAKGGFDACARLADRVHRRWEETGELPANLPDLRTALFMDQRRWRWGDEQPFTEDEWRYWSALVDAMRELLPAEEQG